MMRTFLQTLFDRLRDWWGACVPSAVPVPALPEISSRDALFTQLADLRASHARGCEERHRGIQASTMSLNEAKQAVEACQIRLAEQFREAWLADLRVGTQIERLEARIIEAAPISLGMFIEDIDHELNRLRQMEPTIIPNGTDKNYALGKTTVRFQTNAGSIKRRVVSLQTARERAVALQTESLSVKKMLDEMDRLRRAFPEIVDEQSRGSHAAMVLSN